MGVFKKIKARRAEKKARENINWDNPTQPTKRGYKQNGFDAGEGTGSHSSGPNKSGNDNYVSPQLTRPKEAAIKVTPKKVTKIDAPESKAPEVKRVKQEAPKETADVYRARKAQELTDKKKALEAKQKAVTADKANKKPVAPDYSKKTNKPYKGVTSDDKKSQANIEAGNKRAIANRKAKAAAKPGDVYKYEKPDGTIVNIKKGGSTKNKGKDKQV